MSDWRRRYRSVRKDYSRKRFSNPLFGGERGAARPGRLRRRLWFLAGLTVLAGWAWLLVWSDVFRLSRIEISGNDQIPAWEIRDAVEEVLGERFWWVVPKRSLFLASEAEIAARLQDRFVLESLEVTKQPPRTLRLVLKERVSSILLQFPGRSQALLDLTGAVIRLFRPEEALDASVRLGPSKDGKAEAARRYHVLFDDREEGVRLREKAIGPSVAEAVTQLPKLVEETFGNAPYVTELHLDGKASRTLQVLTSEGWAIYVTAEAPLRDQLANAKTVLKDKIGAGRKDLEYIDVRFGEKVFFKLR
jgi:hypothetical protein